MLKLPPLQQAILEADVVARLFHDLATCTQIRAVVPKRRLHTQVEEAPIELATAQEELCRGILRGVQIRYLYEGREWCDTLLGLDGGRARLVRIATDELTGP